MYFLMSMILKEKESPMLYELDVKEWEKYLEDKTCCKTCTGVCEQLNLGVIEKLEKSY